jgi:glycosyltransferase involved in cell wall biosynthesis
MRLEDITPVVLTFNEAPNIRRCLEKLSWASEIVVLDSFSTDGTPDLASAHGRTRVVQRAFDDHTSQWNHGVAQAATPWILSLDADYIVPSGLETELRALEPASDKAAYFADFRYCILGKALRASLYPPRAVLFRRDRCTYVEDGHTQLLRVNGPTGRLASVFDHDDRKPLSRWLQSQVRYAELEARHLLSAPISDLKTADRIRRWIIPAPLLVCFLTLVGKGLILDGWAGWYYVMQRTLAELILSLQLVHQKLAGTTTKP